MKIPNNTIKRIIKDITDIPVENKAIYFLALNLENTIMEKTKLAVELHHERNKLRHKHGLPDKKRLSEEIYKEVLKND